MSIFVICPTDGCDGRLVRLGDCWVCRWCGATFPAEAEGPP